MIYEEGKEYRCPCEEHIRRFVHWHNRRYIWRYKVNATDINGFVETHNCPHNDDQPLDIERSGSWNY